MAEQLLPSPAAPFSKPDGRPDDTWYQRLTLMWKAFNALTTTQASDTTSLQASIAAIQVVNTSQATSIAALQSSVTALQGLSGSASYDPPNLNDTVGTTTTVAVAGATLGMFAEASFSLDLQGITVTAWVSASDTVSVRFQNESGGAINLGSGTLTVRARA